MSQKEAWLTVMNSSDLVRFIGFLLAVLGTIYSFVAHSLLLVLVPAIGFSLVLIANKLVAVATFIRTNTIDKIS